LTIASVHRCYFELFFLLNDFCEVKVQLAISPFPAEFHERSVLTEGLDDFTLYILRQDLKPENFLFATKEKIEKHGPWMTEMGESNSNEFPAVFLGPFLI
jgi:hypothetical protein